MRRIRHKRGETNNTKGNENRREKGNFVLGIRQSLAEKGGLWLLELSEFIYMLTVLGIESSQIAI